MNSPLTPIKSKRLELVPMSPEFLRASLRGEWAAAAAILGASLPPEWPDLPRVLELRLSQLEADAGLQPWLLRAMVRHGDRTMVGHIGFHTAPAPEYLAPYAPGGIEFGFSVFPAFRRLGYAHEAAEALMDWAQEQHGLRSFVLTISPRNAASQALAARLGFVRIGSHMDAEDGEEDFLERKV